MEKLTKALVMEWLAGTSGWFTYQDFDKEMGVVSLEGKGTRRMIFRRLVEEGLLEKYPYAEGKFRRIDTELSEIAWQDITETATLDIKYPLGLERFVKTYPKSPIIVAAPPGWGKTAFLLNVALLNMNYPQGVFVWSNDVTDVELWERLNDSDFSIPKPAPFKIYERMANFGDVISKSPEALHIIDYLDLNENLYLVGREIDKIYEKLNRGVAFIGLQKNPFGNTTYGYGGVFSAKRAKLYLTIDTKKEMGQKFNLLTIVKARGWADPEINPNGMTFRFKIQRGIRIKRLDEPEEEGVKLE